MISNRKGVTAIELIGTVAIVGLLSTMALPSMKTAVLRYRLKDTAREIATSLRLLRIRAISTNFRTYLDFNPVTGLEDRFYTAFVDENNLPNNNPPAETDATNLLLRDTVGGFRGKRLPTGVHYGWGSDVGKGIAKGSTFPPSDAAAFGSGDRAGFSSDGLPITKGTVYLTNDLDESYAVTVNFAGKVKIRKWDGSSWE